MKSLYRFMKLYRPAGFWVALGVLLSLLTLAANIGLMALSGWFIAAMGLAGVTGASMNYFTPASIIRAFAIFRTGGRYAERLVTHDAALRVTTRLRAWIFDRIQLTETGYTQKKHSSRFFSILRSDCQALENFYLTGFVPICVALLALPMIGVSLFVYMPSVAFFLVSMMLLAGLALPLLLYRLTRNGQRILADDMTLLMHQAADFVQGMDELLIYDAADDVSAALEKRSRVIADSQTRILTQESVGVGLNMLIMNAAVLGVVILALPGGMEHIRSLSVFAMLPLLVLACFDAVAPMQTAFQSLAVARDAAGRIFTLTDRANGVVSGATDVPMEGRGIIFENVCFRYPEGDFVLDKLSFALKPGEAMAVAGPSGIGKSTLVQVMTGLWPAESGSVSLNGIDLQAADPRSWRSCFSVSLQQAFLFSGTVRENLLRASPLADDVQLMEACALAGLDTDLAHMPQGLATDIGEGGVALSGGQGQRLSIARAWLKPSGILILDEPTEGLDRLAGQQMIERLMEKCRIANRTFIVITHNRAISDMFSNVLRLT